jgi:4-amino-4-deoxy-L-arabinose transferase-like glycosyltransferase
MTHDTTVRRPVSSARNTRLWVALAAPLLLLVLCLVLYLWRLGATPLRDFDEAYYAEGAREMLGRGDLLTPYFNGQPFLLKPILIYWIVAAAFRLLGLTEFAARVPSAFLGTLVVLLTYGFAARTVSRRAGVFAGLALSLCYLWIEISRDASIDIPLTAALTAALFGFFLATQAPDRRGHWVCLGSYLLLGIALLAKGPVPAGTVLVGLLCYLLAARRLRQTLRQAHVLPGLVLLLAVAAPWYWYEIRHQPTFFSTFFIGEHVGHIGGELARRQPIWGNVEYLLVFFYPWVAFLPAGLVHAFRQQDRGHVLRFAAWWTIAVVLLFSIPRSKLAHYLAPAFPPMAILVGGWLDAWVAGRPVSRACSGAAFALLGAVGTLSAAVAYLAIADPVFVKDRLVRQFGDWQPGPAPAVIACALATGVFLALASARWRRRALVPFLAASMLVAGLTYIGWFRVRIAAIQAQPRKELAQLAAALLPQGEPLGVYYAKRNATIFYFRRPIAVRFSAPSGSGAERRVVDLGEREDDLPKVARFLASPRPAAVLTHRQFVSRLQHNLGRAPGRVHVLARRGAFVLIANHELRNPRPRLRPALTSATTSTSKGSRSRAGPYSGTTG